VTATAWTITRFVTARHKTTVSGGSLARRQPLAMLAPPWIMAPPGYSGIEAVIATLADEFSRQLPQTGPTGGG
jgi:hypothetical protein